jgi:hypothetical protein
MGGKKKTEKKKETSLVLAAGGGVGDTLAPTVGFSATECLAT